LFDEIEGVYFNFDFSHVLDFHEEFDILVYLVGLFVLLQQGDLLSLFEFSQFMQWDDVVDVFD
jgi:hypothetical protein